MTKIPLVVIIVPLIVAICIVSTNSDKRWAKIMSVGVSAIILATTVAIVYGVIHIEIGIQDLF